MCYISNLQVINFLIFTTKTAVSYTDRLWWDIWNRYTPDYDTYGKFADPDMPMLLIQGDLDPQTAVWLALHSADEYGANIDESGVNDRDRYKDAGPWSTGEGLTNTHDDKLHNDGARGQFQGDESTNETWKIF